MTTHRPSPPSDPAVDAWPRRRHADERLESYRAFLRIPSISALPEHADDCRRAGRVDRRDLRRIGIEHVEVAETGGHPIVYGDWLHAAGRPDGPRLLPLRRPAGRPARALGLAAVRAGRRRRPDARPRRVRRQGPDPHASPRRGGAPRDAAARCRSTCSSSSRARRSRAASTSTRWLEANRERARGRRRDHQRHGLLRGQRARDHRRPAGHDVRPDRRRRDRRRPPLRRLRRRRPEPGQRPRPIIAALKGPDGRIAVPGFYDDVVAARPTRTAPHFAALPFDEEAYRAQLGLPELVRRVRLHDARAARRPADARRQRDVGRLPGRGLEDDHPGPRPRQDQLPARPRPGPRPDLRRRSGTSSSRSRRPASRRRSDSLGGGRPSLTPVDHPVTQAAARALEATFGRAPVYIREGGSIPVCASFESILGLPVVLLGFAPPDDHAHAPNEWMDLGNYETGHPHDRPAVGRDRRSPRRLATA